MPRPTKLTPEIQAAIVDNILHGATYRDAAESVGVTYETFNNWMKWGAVGGKYFEFFNAIRTANAQCALNFTRVIQSAAAKGDVKAAMEWLKRRRREEWGDNVDVTSKGERVEFVVIYDKPSRNTPTDPT